jgi:Mrp family chromosome partitioning ATPase
MKEANNMGSCSGNCSTCGSDCADRKAESLLAKLNERSTVKKVIAVVSGKGGVGKSTVTSMLAVAMARRGKRTAVLDADITGPSAPTAFGVTQCQGANEDGLYPALSRSGIQVMSINLLLDNNTDPVVWRGPVIAGAVKQFWTDVIWEDVDYMFVDMPPGTGDVPLTVFQSLPVDGIVIVTSPQDLVGMIVSKAVKMANMMHIPVLGFVENYSYLECPDCGKKIEVFGKSHLEEVARSFDLPVLAKLPIDPKVAEAFDNGLMETIPTDNLAAVIEKILEA